MIADLIAVLFLSRDIAHREHLSTTSFSQHMALGEFYPGVIDLADKLAEAYQGPRPMPTGFADIEGKLPTLVWPV